MACKHDEPSLDKLMAATKRVPGGGSIVPGPPNGVSAERVLPAGALCVCVCLVSDG